MDFIPLAALNFLPAGIFTSLFFCSFIMGGRLCRNLFLPSLSVMFSPSKQAVGTRAHSQEEGRRPSNLPNGPSLEAPEKRDLEWLTQRNVPGMQQPPVSFISGKLKLTAGEGAKETQPFTLFLGITPSFYLGRFQLNRLQKLLQLMLSFYIGYDRSSESSVSSPRSHGPLVTKPGLQNPYPSHFSFQPLFSRASSLQTFGDHLHNFGHIHESSVQNNCLTFSQNWLMF